MAVVLVATLTPLPEHRDAVIAAFEAILPAVHAEPGCELYALHEQGPEIVIIEKWTSEETLAEHRAGAALAGLGPALEGKMAGASDLKILAPRPFGDAERGAL